MFCDLKIVHSQLTPGTKLSHALALSCQHLHNLSAPIHQLSLGLRYRKTVCLFPNLFASVCLLTVYIDYFFAKLYCIVGTYSIYIQIHIYTYIYSIKPQDFGIGKALLLEMWIVLKCAESCFLEPRKERKNNPWGEPQLSLGRAACWLHFWATWPCRTEQKAGGCGS